jgi:single-stranded-DNA-specific exonuclease
LEKYGGHKYAAGLTLDKSNLHAFRERFEQVVAESITEEMLTPIIEIDVPVTFDSLTAKFYSVLKQMAPFGPDNLRPVFEAKNVFVVNALSSFKEKHIRFVAGQHQNNALFNAVGFDLAEHYERLAAGDYFNMAFTLEENTFNGITSLQVRIKDIKFDKT